VVYQQDCTATSISRDCSYFKVTVDFEAVGRPNRDKDGRVTLEEDTRDIIVNVSRPYLQFAMLIKRLETIVGC